MAISYPLNIPATKGAKKLNFRAKSTVGASVSPFTAEQQVFVHQGEWFEVDVMLPPMKRVDAEEWVGFLLKLNGMEGTFLMGDPLGATPRGTWAGTPLVNGAHAVGVKTVAIDGFSAGATGKIGDWMQHGTGAGTHLHKVVQDFVEDGAGRANVEIWPRLKSALADNAVFTKTAAKGLWRLATNERSWSIEDAQMYGIAFVAMEAF